MRTLARSRSSRLVTIVCLLVYPITARAAGVPQVRAATGDGAAPTEQQQEGEQQQEQEQGQGERPVFESEALPAGEPIELDAYAEFRKGGVFISDGQRVQIWHGTAMAGEAVPNPSDIELGYRFKVEGVRLANGMIVAETVTAEPNTREFLSGSVEAMSNDLENAWTQVGYVYQDEGDHRAVIGDIIGYDDRVVRVERMMNRLKPPYLAPGEIRVYVVEAELWNATAFPNGSIWVNTALIDDLTNDELAIVLGHELAHYTHEHARKDTGASWWQQTLASLGAGIVLGFLPGGTARDVGQVAAAAGSRMWTAGYGSALEAQADRVGTRYAFEAGYDVYAGVDIWTRFRERYGHRTYDNESLLEAHVKPDDRIENIENEIEINYRHEIAEMEKTLERH
jgi:Zn-dependent protease with chaperone function